MTKVKRLSEFAKPLHYDLKINLNESQQRFEGSVSIRLELNKDSKQIYLHSNGLEIDKAAHDGKELTVKHGNHDELELGSSDTLTKGEHHIYVEFSSDINDKLHGLYPSKFSIDETEHTIYATQFESHHAREVFPCIDEPLAKATFKLELECDKHRAILSNTPIEQQSEKNGRVTTLFEKTPKMSTYLLAIVVGELDKLSATSGRGIEINTYSTPDKVKQTDYALQTAVKVIDYFEEYFDIEFPLQKCDLVALPDFVTGAMENWGLITYRETAMLIDESAGRVGEMRVTQVVAHELAHQWFGNLVTMNWWTDLWLNEGFASWIENLAADKLHPDWNIWTNFVSTDIIVAQNLDSLEHSHAVEIDIEDPDEIRAIFDAISYQKGASVIHMIYNYLGPNDFQEGLRYYLKKYQYSNAETADLWAALEEISAKPVTKMMSSWTKQVGFPVLNVDENTITQKRFLANPEARSDSNQWPVPLLNGSDELLESTDGKFNKINVPLNQGRSGFYYTNYSSEQLTQVLNQKIETIDQIGLLNESFHQFKSGYGDISSLSRVIESIRDSDNSTLFGELIHIIMNVRRVFPEIDKDLKQFALQISEDKINRYGFETTSDDDHNTTQLKPLISSLASYAEAESFTSYASKQFKLPLEKMNADTQSAVLAHMVKIDNENTDQIISWHSNTTSARLKMKLAGALASVKDEKRFNQALELIDSEQVRSQDVYYWLAYLTSNRWNYHLANEWLGENWDWINEQFGTDIATFAYVPIFMSKNLKEQSQEDDFKMFFETHSHKGIDRQIKQAIEHIQIQKNWRKRNKSDINKLYN